MSVDIESIVETEFNRLTAAERSEFATVNEEDLVMLHLSYGMFIRNEYKLWSYEWNPEIVEGVDKNENHPDSISMKIIKRLWKMCK